MFSQCIVSVWEMLRRAARGGTESAQARGFYTGARDCVELRWIHLGARGFEVPCGTYIELAS